VTTGISSRKDPRFLWVCPLSPLISCLILLLGYCVFWDAHLRNYRIASKPFRRMTRYRIRKNYGIAPSSFITLTTLPAWRLPKSQT